MFSRDLTCIFRLLGSFVGCTAFVQPLCAHAGEAAGVSAVAEPAAAPMSVRLAYTVVQTGRRSGITNTLYTNWLPNGGALSSLSGVVSLTGNTAGFSEALVTVGTTWDDQAVCVAGNTTWPAQAPPIRRLWAGILKDNTTETVAIPVNFLLPYPAALPVARTGVCLATLVSAGYPFLDRLSARYTQTAVNLVATIASLPPASSVAPIGLGGEFKLNTNAGPSAYTFVGIRAARALQVDGIAGSVSAAAVLGAPPDAGWTPTPDGAWAIGTSFIYIPSAACQSAGFTFQKSNGTVSVMRRGTPSPFGFPSGSLTIMDLPISGYMTLPTQLAGFHSFPDFARPAASLTLGSGDCLVSFQHLLSSATSTSGQIDYENQSTVYLRTVP